MRKCTWACVLLLASSGCGGNDSSDAQASILVDVPVTELGAVADAPSVPWTVAADPVFRLGSWSSEQSQLFGDVTAVAGRSDGSVLVADGQSGVVRVYDSAGSPLGVIGSAGDGPGELRVPTSLLVLPGDSLLVWDSRHWRTTLYASDGAFVRAESYDPAQPGVYPIDGMWPATVELGGPGSHVVHLATKGDFGRADQTSELSGGVALHHRGMHAPELLARLPPPAQVALEAPWGSMMVPAPVEGGPDAAIDPGSGRICVGHHDIAELRCRDESGRSLGLRWTDEARPLAPEQGALDTWRQELVTFFAGKVSESEVEEMTRGVTLSDSHPAFSGLTFDADGYLWIRLGPAVEQTTDEYLVLTDELAVHGRITLPVMEQLVISHTRVLGIQETELGLQEVVAWELVR